MVGTNTMWGFNEQVRQSKEHNTGMLCGNNRQSNGSFDRTDNGDRNVRGVRAYGEVKEEWSE